MVLNVKPEKRDNMVTRDAATALTYRVYSSSFSVTLAPPEEVHVKPDIAIGFGDWPGFELSSPTSERSGWSAAPAWSTAADMARNSVNSVERM